MCVRAPVHLVFALFMAVVIGGPLSLVFVVAVVFLVVVLASSCKVMTILHPSFNAAGVISRTRENGIITGSADNAADGQCVLTNLDRATEARKGDQVITTGLGGVFPANLLVGTVQEVVPEQSGKSSSAVILPGADPRTVKHVFIVKEY